LSRLWSSGTAELDSLAFLSKDRLGRLNILAPPFNWSLKAELELSALATDARVICGFAWVAPRSVWDYLLSRIDEIPWEFWEIYLAGKEIWLREQLLFLSSASFSWSLWAHSATLLAFNGNWFCTWPACPLFCTLFCALFTSEKRLWSDLERVLWEKLLVFPVSLEPCGLHAAQTESFFDKRVARLSFAFVLSASKDGVFPLWFSA
jgi:hypothetical protein